MFRRIVSLLMVGLMVVTMLSAPLSAMAQEVESPKPSPASDAPPLTLEPIRRAQRSARFGVAMSLAVPGWGQLYADSPFWGVAAFAVQMFYVGSIVMEGQRMDRSKVDRDRFERDSAEWIFRDGLVTEHRERRRDFVWWASAAAFIIALDSYVSIELAGFDSNDPPVPDLDRPWAPSRSSGDGVALRVHFGF